MTIAVFGATGKIGKHFIATALKNNFKIRALARFSASVDPVLEHAKLVKGEIFDPNAVNRVLLGADAVLFVAGLKKNKTLPLFSLGTATVIEEMKERNIKRLVVVSEANYGQHIHEAKWATKMLDKMKWIWGTHALEERMKQDDIVLNSGLDYTIIRPCKLSDNAPENKPINYSTHPIQKSTILSYPTFSVVLLAQFKDKKNTIDKQIYL